MTTTDIKPYDDYEISPCRRFEEEDRPGHYYFEVCEPHEADVWTLYGHLPEGGVEAIADSDTEEQARELYQRITGQLFGTHKENGATARLMRSAPELLEALESALKNAEFEKQAPRPWHDKARAAIAKATGRAA